MSLNTYSYANGSPLVYSDPDGLAGRGGIGGRVGKVLGRPLAKGFDKLIGRSPGARAAYAARLQARMHANRLARDAKIAARIAKGKKNPANPVCDIVTPNQILGQGYHREVIAPNAVRSKDATKRWDDFLGEKPYSNTHPRTGSADPDRIVSADGQRSIRYGDHEMQSQPNKHHYHEELWTPDRINGVMNVDNTIVRISK